MNVVCLSCIMGMVLVVLCEKIGEYFWGQAILLHVGQNAMFIL